MKNKYCGKVICMWDMPHRHLEDGSILVRSGIVVPEELQPRLLPPSTGQGDE